MEVAVRRLETSIKGEDRLLLNIPLFMVSVLPTVLLLVKSPVTTAEEAVIEDTLGRLVGASNPLLEVMRIKLLDTG
jgi:hypothetical protein